VNQCCTIIERGEGSPRGKKGLVFWFVQLTEKKRLNKRATPLWGGRKSAGQGGGGDSEALFGKDDEWKFSYRVGSRFSIKKELSFSRLQRGPGDLGRVFFGRKSTW